MGRTKLNVVPLDAKAAKKKEQQESSEAQLYQGIPCEKPPRPRWLSKGALEHWDFITDELEKHGLITKLDQGSLVNLCISYAQMREAEAHIQAEGFVQETPNGYEQLSPWSVVYERASARYTKIAMQFGLTVRARAQIKQNNPNQAELDLDL